MNKSDFRNWLTARGTLSKRTIENVISYCSTVEKYEGDIDILYDSDCLLSLLRKMEYTREDEKNNAKPAHAIPIAGNVYNSTAQYKNAIKKYKEYREKSAIVTAPITTPTLSSVSTTAVKYTSKKAIILPWPVWPDVSEDAVYNLAIEVVPYIQFLSPEIVEAITKENRNNKANIDDSLRDVGIDPEYYMWDGSPCAFPGIRRSVGNGEKKGKWLGEPGFSENSQDKGTAIYLDDNDMPKQIWAFTFTGTYFRKKGPKNYSLAHLIDHKVSGNRMKDCSDSDGNQISGEFDNVGKPFPLYGLFSSPANSAYITTMLMKPTDYNGDLRKLLIAKAYELYGSCCNIVPSRIKLKSFVDPRFDINNPVFKWAPPVGDLTNFSRFCEYRSQLYINHGFPDMYI